jgi:glycosyltransferase involved in cell wall biosynthesis
LYFSHTAYPRYVHHSKKFLSQFGLETKLTNKRVCPLPRNFMGRAEQYFNRMYQLLGLDVEKIAFDHDIYSKTEVFYSPYYPVPSHLKKFPGLKKVITIHDLIPLLDSRYGAAARKGLENTIHSIHDGYVICVSNHTRNDLLTYYNQIDPEKVFVSYLAADPEKFYHCTDESKFAEVRNKYGLPGKYMLSLCMMEPRKNLDHLVRCFIRFVKEQHIKDLSLVLIGSSEWDPQDVITEMDVIGSYRDRIVLTGRVPDEDLASIYSHAHSFYFMSEYEGFGLPPLEAMQCGVPTVTSNVTSLPEVVGDGGIMLAPTDEDGLCNIMYQLYSNAELNAEYRNRGMQRAKKFSWDRCADEHINIFKTIS